MSTEVVITGSGTPIVVPGRAGPGALIRTTTTAIQVDAGRATALRLAEAGVGLNDLDAMLLTHHHSDHLLGLTDLVLSRWIANGVRPYETLPIHCPAGPAVTYLERLFDQLEPDIQSRIGVAGYPDRPEPAILPFEAAGGRFDVAVIGDVTVQAATVDHGDLAPAVGFRFTTPDGVIVVSGDTTSCIELEALAQGADVLVHEAFSAELVLKRGAPPTQVENLGHHHTEAKLVGEIAARVGVPNLLITHMIPPPSTPEHTDVFLSAIRAGGYDGDVTIADDLTTVVI